MLVYNKDDIEFVTEFPCLLGHPVLQIWNQGNKFDKFDSVISFLRIAMPEYG